jgi:hypothetical protein
MKFERIYSPEEWEVKRRRNAVKATRKWRARHPEWVASRRAVMSAYMKQWHKNHPGAHQASRKKSVRLMRPTYLAQLLRQHGRPVTPETLAQKKTELQAYRTRRLFRTFYATSQISDA